MLRILCICSAATARPSPSPPGATSAPCARHAARAAARRKLTTTRTQTVRSSSDAQRLALRSGISRSSSTRTWQTRPSARSSRRATSASSAPRSNPDPSASTSTIEDVERVRALQAQLVVRRQPRNREQRRLDLGREDVDAAHDQHVVGTALDPADPRKRPAARARRAGERGEIARAVAQERHRLPRQAREHELALDVRPAARAPVSGFDDLDDEVVLADVGARLLGALTGDAGTHHLGEPVDVERAQAEPPLDLVAHRDRPGLGAEQAVRQGVLARVDARPPRSCRRCAARRTECSRGCERRDRRSAAPGAGCCRPTRARPSRPCARRRSAGRALR